MNNIMIDTGYWYALFNARDSHHTKANELLYHLDLGTVIVPYPTLYETINTRFTKNRSGIEEFSKTLSKDNVRFIEDLEYKENALSLTFEATINKNRPISLVDMVIRLMLEDVNLKIDSLISFNTGDFIDICYRKGIAIIN